MHKGSNVLELEAELDDRMLRITGNLDAVIIPPRYGPMQYKEFLLGGVEVKHSTIHKECGYVTIGRSNGHFIHADLEKRIGVLLSFLLRDLKASNVLT